MVRRIVDRLPRKFAVPAPACRFEVTPYSPSTRTRNSVLFAHLTCKFTGSANAGSSVSQHLTCSARNCGRGSLGMRLVAGALVGL